MNILLYILYYYIIIILLDRAFKINNTWMGFHLHLKQVIRLPKQNCYPERLLNRITKHFLNSKYVDNNIEDKSEPSGVFYFKLPFIQENCRFKQIKLICNWFNINMDAVIMPVMWD